jgi:large subunit ribosomal protein L28
MAIKETCMSRKCEISGKKGKVGNLVSHSKRRTKTVQEANLQWKRFWLEDEERWVRFRVSTKMIKTISKNGLKATLRKFGKLKALLK